MVVKWYFDSEQEVEDIESFELYYHKLDNNSSVQNNEWTLVGVVNALPMPMACFLKLVSSNFLNIFMK